MRDMGLVFEGLAPNIDELLTTHKVGNSAAEVVYNNIEHVGEVGCVVCDDFEALMILRSLRAVGLKSNSGVSGSQGRAPAAPASAGNTPAASTPAASTPAPA